MMRRALAAAVTLVVGVAGCGAGPEGDQPARTPGPSPAPADFVLDTGAESEQALEAAGLRMRPLPDDAVLNGPHYAFALDSVAVVTTLNQDRLDALHLSPGLDPMLTELVAGDGREFLVVYIGKPQSAPVPQRGEAEAEVVVDGQAYPLSRVPAAGMVVVANVPAGARTVLAVTDAGQTKTISLRTGRRVPVSGPELASSAPPPSSPADALVGGTAHLEDMVHIDRVTPAGKGYEFSVSVQVRPYSFVDDHGRAEPGRMWLRVELELAMPALELDGEPVQLDLDVAESLVIRGGGEPVPVPDDAVAEQTNPSTEFGPTGWARVDWSGVLDAPDTLREVEVSFRTHGTFTAGSRELSSTRFDRRNSGTIDLAGE